MSEITEAPATGEVSSFDTLSLSPGLRASLKQLEYQTMTPIQAANLPISLSGTWMPAGRRTARFAVPADQSQPRRFAVQAMVYPTRELAEQVTRGNPPTGAL